MNKPIIELNRFESNEKQTLGNLLGTKEANSGIETIKLVTLELAWKDNRRSISCIPEGWYDVEPRTTPSRGPHFHILNVPMRTWILFHKGNFYFDIEGCTLPGLRHSDINGDGYRDVVSSAVAMGKLLEFAPDGFRLHVVDTYKQPLVI